MTPDQVLDKYRHIVVVNANQMALEISNELGKRPVEEQRKHFGGDHKYGFFYLFNAEKHPDKIMETVVSPKGDAITSLYMADPLFASIGDVMKARRELCHAISERIGLSLEAAGVEDSGRGRMLGLEELGTGQLIDLLAGQMGASLITTNSVGGSVDVVAQDVAK